MREGSYNLEYLSEIKRRCDGEKKWKLGLKKIGKDLRNSLEMERRSAIRKEEGGEGLGKL